MVAVDAGRARALRDRVEADRSAGRARTRLESFPSNVWARWAVRLAFAVPYLAVALVVAGADVGGVTVNGDAVAHVGAISWDRADAAWIGDLYPPLGTVLIRVIPGGAIGLAVVGALVAGVLLQLLLEVMVQRRFEWWKTAVFLIAIGANPLFAYTVTGNFEAFLTIALFGVGMTNAVRFVTGGNTKAGFEAGILFMLAALSDASGLALVVSAALTVPLLSLARRTESGARWSNVLVVLFPTLAVFGSVVFLQLSFLHDPFAVFRRVVHYDPTRWAIIPYLLNTLDGLLILAPILCGVALALLARRPGSICISLILFASVILGYVGGLIPQNSAGNVFLVMTLMGIAIIPAVRTRRTSAFITAVGALQIVIAWAAAFNRPVTLEWMGALVRSLGWS